MATPNRKECRDGDIVVQLVSPDPQRGDEVFLSEDDRIHLGTLSDVRRGLFIAGRAAAYRLLSALTTLDTSTFRIAGAGDRPFLRWSASHSNNQTVDLSFSYAEDVVLVGVGVGCRIGVDIENLASRTRRPERRYDIILEEYFSDLQPDALPSSKEANPEEAFLKLWTRHEAEHKVLGQGLTFPATDTRSISRAVDSINIDVGAGHVAALAVDRTLAECRIRVANGRPS